MVYGRMDAVGSETGAPYCAGEGIVAPRSRRMEEKGRYMTAKLEEEREKWCVTMVRLCARSGRTESVGSNEDRGGENAIK